MDDMKQLETILFMKAKLDAFQRIKEYVGVVERKHGRTPRYMHFDNASDLVGSEINGMMPMEGWSGKKPDVNASLFVTMTCTATSCTLPSID